MTAETSLPTCYRHDDRETRLSCSNCGRPVCVECVRSAPVGQKCPECAQGSGRSRVITADQIRGGLRASAPLTFALLVMNVAIYAAGFLLPGVSELLYDVGRQANPLVANGDWWRLFTAAFLHAPGFTHILFNMYALYIFGPDLERQVGGVPFGLLYISSALAGGAAFFLLGPGGGSAVGASGAIFGLLGAWLVAAYRNRSSGAGMSGLRQLLVLLGINLALPLLLPGIAWQAHVGGLVAGMLIAAAWQARPINSSAAERGAVAAAVGGLALLVVLLG